MTLAFAATLLLHPSAAHANGGGVIESDEEYGYGNLYLRWRTGDFCDNHSSCFELSDKPARWFRWFFGEEVSALGGVGLEGRSVWKVNVPPESNGLVFGQLSMTGGDWFVYDGAKKRFLIQTPKYPEALAVWSREGMSSPTFEDAENPPSSLSHSLSSMLESLTLWAVPLVVVGLIAVPLMIRRKRRTQTDVPPKPAS